MFRCYKSLGRGPKLLILVALELLAISSSCYLAYVLQFSTLVPGDAFWTNLTIMPVLLFVSRAGLVLSGRHRPPHGDHDARAILHTALLAMGMGLVSFCITQVSGDGLLAGYHVTVGLIFFLLHVAGQRVLRVILTQPGRRSGSVSRVAIYGTGKSALALARDLRVPEDILPCAFLDDDPAMEGMVLNGLPVHAVGRAARLKALYNVDRVILAMPALRSPRLTVLTSRMKALGFEVQNHCAFAQPSGGDMHWAALKPASSSLLARETLDQDLGPGALAYRGARVLITGAGGSIGAELCRQIMACRPAQLILCDLSECALYSVDTEMRALADPLGIEVVSVLGSIADQMLMESVLARHAVDVVLHAAAYKHVPMVEANVRVGLANNTLGTAILARAARHAGVRRFVLVSSDKAVHPRGLMGASKRLAELVVQDLATRSEDTIFSIVRFGNVVGSSGSVIPRFQEQIAMGGPVTLTSERVTRYFMTIEEAAHLVLLAGSFAEGGEVFMLDMGPPLRIGDLARQMIVSAGYSVRDAANPDGEIEIVTTGLRPGEKLHEDLSYGAGAQLTTHAKILRLREHHLSELEMAAVLRDLREAVESGSDEAVRAVVVRSLPDYAPHEASTGWAPACAVDACRSIDANQVANGSSG